MPANLCRRVRRRRDRGLIQETDGRPDPEMDDERTRSIRVMAPGEAVANGGGSTAPEPAGGSRRSSCALGGEDAPRVPVETKRGGRPRPNDVAPAIMP